MEKTEITKMIMVVKTNYPHYLKDCTKEDLSIMINTWYEMFKDYDKEMVWVALKNTFAVCKYPPTIADVMENIKKINDIAKPSENELWNLVVRAITKTKQYVYHGMHPVWIDGEFVANPQEKVKAIYSELPKEIQMYLGCFNTLIDLSNLETLEYEKARFVKTINQVKESCDLREKINLQQIGVVDRKLLNDGE